MLYKPGVAIYLLSYLLKVAIFCEEIKSPVLIASLRVLCGVRCSHGERLGCSHVVHSSCEYSVKVCSK